VGLATVGVVVASVLLAGPSEVASAGTGSGGQMTAAPSTAIAGSKGNAFNFRFVAKGQTATKAAAGTVALVIPATWTAPVETGAASGPGHVSITASSCAKAKLGKITAQGAKSAAGPWSVPVTISCLTGKTFTLHYADATVSHVTGAVALRGTFTVGKTVTALIKSPTVTIKPGPLTRLQVHASPTAINPFIEAPHADITGTQLSTITTLGFDRFGNLIGNEGANTTLSISPSGDCGPNFCETGGSGLGTDTVTATDGTATGHTTITVTLAGLQMSCQGENYDLNSNVQDGCEASDAPQGNHVLSTAANEGEVSDCDTPFEIDGTMLADDRVHADPAVVGFDTTTGSAPDWMSVFGEGNTFCENDLVVTLQVLGSAQPSCYKLTAITDKNTYTVQTDTTGLAQINHDSGGQFSDNTTIDFEVQKTCSTSLSEEVSYSITGHL
jgi:hypothetical protein